MGAENSALKDCEVFDLIHHFDDENWDLHDAVGNQGDDLSVFYFKKKDKNDLDLLQLNSQHLKTIRHPNILHYVSSGKGPDGSYLLTEKVVPLTLVLPSLSFHEVISGLHDILEALIFLHDAKISHNNINISAVYLSMDRRWKVGGFEHVCSFQDATAEFLLAHSAFRCKDAIAPEEKEKRYSLSVEWGHVRDVYAFGALADVFLEHLGDVGDVTKTFAVIVEDECLNSDPNRRPHLRSVKQNKLFRNDFIAVRDFLKHIPLKTKQEKEDFFRTIVPKLIGLPEELVAKHLTKPLLARFVLLDDSAKTYMVPHLLTPCRKETRPTICRKGEITPVLTVPVFRDYVLPELFKIFHVRDSCIRTVLLLYFGSYVDLFPEPALKSVILPQVLLGLADVDDGLVAASLRALADIVPLLGGRTVTQQMSAALNKQTQAETKAIFSAGSPKEPQKSNRSLSPVRSALGKQNKILLKDLALGRANSSNGSVHHINDDGLQENDIEAEVKRLEKERRREEARIRREEKRMQLKEKRALRAREKTQDDPENHIVKGWPENETALSDSTEKRLSKGEVIISQIDEQTEIEKAQKDWDAWDDADHENSSSACDTNDEGSISDEIENELKRMPSTVSLKSPRSGGSSPLKFSPTRHAESEDFTFPKQHSPNKDNESVNNFSDISAETNSVDVASSVDWNSVNQWNQGKKVTSPTRKSLSKLKFPKTSVKKSDAPLGAEFDIMEIQVKKVSKPETEPDFFADMIPEISTTTAAFSPVTMARSPRSPLNKKSPTSQRTALSFAVTTSQDADGWGDEEDWGADF